MHFGDALMGSNDEAKAGNSAAGDWTLWFTKTSAKQDLTALKAVIDGANDAILFVMFEPGKEGALKMIRERMRDKSRKKLYVQGVVNSLDNAEKAGNVNVDLVSPGRPAEPFDLQIIEPQGVGKGLAKWATEVMRQDFLISQGGAIGHAITHSKMIVIDPFTNPHVITGSHNLSERASTKNDDHFVVIKGDAALAQRYAVNIMGVYEHYVWRSSLDAARKAGRKLESKDLETSDAWQAPKLKAGAEKLAFWTQNGL